MSDQEDAAPAARNARGASGPSTGRAGAAATSVVNVIGADPDSLLTSLHMHTARSSHTKTFPATSTASS